MEAFNLYLAENKSTGSGIYINPPLLHYTNETTDDHEHWWMMRVISLVQNRPCALTSISVMILTQNVAACVTIPIFLIVIPYVVTAVDDL